MQNRIGLFLLTLLIIVLLYLLLQKPEKINDQLINTVTLQNNGTVIETADKATIKTSKEQPQNNSDINRPPVPEDTNSNKTRTYMQIYQDLQLAQECNSFYTNNHEATGNYDYLTELHNAHRYLVGKDEQAPEKQVVAMESFIQQCLDLKVETFSRAKIFEEFPAYQLTYPVLVELRKEFQQTKPETPEEIHLSKTIQISQQWDELWRSMHATLKGAYKYDKNQRDIFEEQISELQEQIGFLYQTNPDNTETIDELNDQVNQLLKQSNERLPVDEAKLTTIMSAFLPIDEQMKQLLKTTHPESFRHLITTMQLNDKYNLQLAESNYHLHISTQIPESFVWPELPNQRILEHSAHKDQEIFDLLIQPASFLYLCYLGADCGTDSEIVRNYCLSHENGHFNSYVDACGKPLVDFYNDDYLTPNQWTDVSTLFETMVEMYAQ